MSDGIRSSISEEEPTEAEVKALAACGVQWLDPRTSGNYDQGDLLYALRYGYELGKGE